MPPTSSRRMARSRVRAIAVGVAATLVATAVPATVNAAMPALPELFAEPNTWELPPLETSGNQSSWLQTDHDIALCDSGPDSGMCVLRTTTPIVSAASVEPHPDLGYEYVVWDLSADNAQGATSGATWDTEWQVPAGILQQGQTYVATVSPASEPGAEQPPADENNLVQLFQVDLTGVGTQELHGDLGFGVAPFTGELVVAGNIAGSDVSLPVDVSWSSVSLSQDVVGPMSDPLPGAWTIDVGVPVQRYLIEAFPAAGALEMWSMNGTRQRYYDNGDGTYRLALDVVEENDGTASLTRDNTYGGWRYLDEFGNEYIFDFRGQLRTYTTGFEDGYGAMSYDFEWATPDLLGSVTDPVTGRSVEFHYAGVSEMCATAPAGFDRAPLNSLCAVSVHDDPADPSATRLTTLGWSDGQVAAFLTPDGTRIDLRYDQGGNIVGLRNPVHAVPAAMGAVDAQSTDLETTFAYDSEGRVTDVTYPVQELGGDRGAVDFTYGAGESRIEMSMIDSSSNSWVTRTFDPETWVVETTEFSNGMFSEMLFDDDGAPIGAISNTTQTYVETHDSPSIEQTTWGPAPTYMFDPVTRAPLPEHRDAMPRATELYDSTPDANGWLVTWWDDAARDSASVAVAFEQDADITAAPDGVGAGWSAEFLGFVPAVVDGEYSVEVTGAELESFSVEGVEGDPTAIMQAPSLAGKVVVEAMVTGDAPPSPDQPLSLVVTADDGTEITTFGIDQTTAGLQLLTEKYEYDFLTTDGPAVERRTLNHYEDPFVGLVSDSVSYIDGVEDLTQSYTYEGFSTDFDELHRPLSTTEGSGFEVVAAYWGAAERAVAPGASTAALQGGLERSGTDPHPTDPQLPGRTVSRWWTAHGMQAAVHDDSTDTTTTFDYDDRLRETRMHTSAGFQPGGGGAMSPERNLEIEYLVTAEGYPATVTTSTVDGEVLTATAVSNLGGAHIISVDYYGAQTHTTYGTDAVTRVTYLDTPLGGLVEVSSTTEIDPRTGQIIAERATTLTGEEIYAELTYNPDEPAQLTRVDYWNGFSVAFDYDDYSYQVGRTWTDAAGTSWSDDVTLTASGRMADRVQATNGDVSTYDYAFHPNGTAAEVVLTSAEGVTTWNLGFDELPAELAGSNPSAVLARTPSTIDTTWADGSRDEITVGYDRANAPQVVTRNGAPVEVVVDRTDVVVYDETTMLYDQTHALISVMSGETGRTFEYDAAGTVTRTTNVHPDRTLTTERAGGGLTLVDGEVVNQTIGFSGGLILDIDARGDHLRIGDFFDNTWAELAPGVDSLGEVEPLRFLPYGQPIPGGTAAKTETVVENEAAVDNEPVVDNENEEPVDVSADPGYGWLGLSVHDGANLVTFAGARLVINEIGSFAQVDPLRVGASDYSYTDGNPFDQHDRSGNQPTQHQMEVLFGALGVGLVLFSIVMPVSHWLKLVLWHVVETAVEAALLWAMLEAGFIDKDQFVALVITLSVLNVLSLTSKFFDSRAAATKLKMNVKRTYAKWKGTGSEQPSVGEYVSGSPLMGNNMSIDFNNAGTMRVRTQSNEFLSQYRTGQSQGTRLAGVPESQMIPESNPGLHQMATHQFTRPDTSVGLYSAPRSRTSSLSSSFNSVEAGMYPLETRYTGRFRFNQRSIDLHDALLARSGYPDGIAQGTQNYTEVHTRRTSIGWITETLDPDGFYQHTYVPGPDQLGGTWVSRPSDGPPV